MDSLSSPPLKLLTRALAQNRGLWVCLLLVLSVAAVFWPVAGNEFTYYDDDGYTTENPQVQGRLNDATAQLGQAVGLKPDFPLGQYNLGCGLAEEGRRDEAVAHSSEALRLKADHEQARRELERLGVKGKAEDGE